MADKAELLAEAYKRGLLPPDKKAAYEEAMKRGLVPAVGGTSPAPRKRSVLENISGSFATMNRKIPLADEMAAGFGVGGDVLGGRVRSTADLGASWNRNRAVQKGMSEDFVKAHPFLGGLSEGTAMAGSVLIPGGAAAKSSVLAPRLANIVGGASVAGLTGAGYAAADEGTPAQRLQAASKAVTDPVTLILGGTAGAFAPAAKKAASTSKAPAIALEDLKKAKDAAYQAVDNAGISYTPQAFQDFVADARSALAKANVSPIRHPRATSMLNDLEGMAKTGHAPSLTQLDQLRQVIRRDVVDVSDKAEKFFGRKLVDSLDNFIENAPATAVSSGVAQDAQSLLAKARDLNMRMRKVEAVEGAVSKAKMRAGSTGSGGNVDNATRQNLRVVLEKTPNFTAEEKAALETVVLGGKGQNMLRLAGKLSPSGNGLMAAGNLGAAAMAGPVGAIPGAVGIASKFAADRMTQRNVAEVLRVISSDKATKPALNRAAQAINAMPKTAASDALRKALAAKLERYAGASRPTPQQSGGIDLGDIDRSTNPEFLARQRTRSVLATEGR